jgi:hypothetical protein
MDPRTPHTTPPPVPPVDRPDAHNTSIDEPVAKAGACGQVHLPTGRTCVLEHGHEGACEYVPRPEVGNSLAEHRAAEGW